MDSRKTLDVHCDTGMIASDAPQLDWVSPLTSLQGVGEKTTATLARAVGGEEVRHLLTSLTHSFIDRRNRWFLHHAPLGQIGTLRIRVQSIDPPGRRGQPTRVYVSDPSGQAEVSLFQHGAKAKFPVGTRSFSRVLSCFLRVGVRCRRWTLSSLRWRSIDFRGLSLFGA